MSTKELLMDEVDDAYVDVIFDSPRTIRDLAAEMRAFLASISTPLVDIEESNKHCALE